MTASPRAAAVDILNKIEAGKGFAEPLLNGFLSSGTVTNADDRGLVTELVYGTLRMRGTLDWVIAQLYRGRFEAMETGLKNVLRTAVYQLYFSDRIPAFAAVDEAVKITKKLYPGREALVNGLLRNVDRRKHDITFPDKEKDPVLFCSIFHSHPLWLVRRWTGLFGVEETIALCRANNCIPPLAVRANRLKAERDDIIGCLQRNGLDCHPTDFSPDGIVITTRGGALKDKIMHQEGLIHVQDEASQLISHLLSPRTGDVVLDLCAGTGGKSTHLAELMGNRGRIVAVDINTQKLAALTETAQRMGVTIIETVAGDATLDLGTEYHNAFDRVLVDAPCSGLGTLRRNPEIKWRLQQENLATFPLLQSKILQAAAPYVKSGGRLVYATCSIMPEENEQVVDDFLSRRRDFEIVAAPAPPNMVDSRGFFHTYPHQHGTDGFFGAVLRRHQ
ncbi:MAG: 16S rRNA (cytosine(967)-C(5))-methyltransferase RsmB [Smithellaceae bacterium]|nr:16S rRNA (cytosine(967)-C(5))-methyltransferase RsmB [Smithellaceae bacterium]